MPPPKPPMPPMPPAPPESCCQQAELESRGVERLTKQICQVHLWAEAATAAAKRRLVLRVVGAGVVACALLVVAENAKGLVAELELLLVAALVGVVLERLCRGRACVSSVASAIVIASLPFR